MRGTHRVRYMCKTEAKKCNLREWPNFSATGSIQGMREKFYGKNAYLVRSGAYIYNVPLSIYLRAH